MDSFVEAHKCKAQNDSAVTHNYPYRSLANPPHTHTHRHSSSSSSSVSVAHLTYQTTQESMAVREAGALISMSLGQWLRLLSSSVSVIRTAS